VGKEFKKICRGQYDGFMITSVQWSENIYFVSFLFKYISWITFLNFYNNSSPNLNKLKPTKCINDWIYLCVILYQLLHDDGATQAPKHVGADIIL
jgi:hypothetical protein